MRGLLLHGMCGSDPRILVGGRVVREIRFPFRAERRVSFWTVGLRPAETPQTNRYRVLENTLARQVSAGRSPAVRRQALDNFSRRCYEVTILLWPANSKNI